MSDQTSNQSPAQVVTEDIKDIQKDGNSPVAIPRMNKRIIMFIIIIFIGCILAGFIFSSFRGKTTRVETPEKRTNVTVPEFDRQIAMHKVDIKQAEPVIPETDQNPYLQQKSTAADSRYLRNADYRPDNSSSRTTVTERNRSREDNSKQRLLAEEEAARRAGITVALGTPGSAGSRSNPDTDTVQARNTSFSGYFPDSGNHAGVSEAAGNNSSETSAYSGYREANMQEEKHSFYTTGKTSGRVIYAEEPAVGLSNLVTAGTVIPAVLLTAINSDLPGEVLAVVTSNIYSFDGEAVLIPQGTKLIAGYNSSVSWNQQRIQIAWNRLIRPDGVSIYLGNMSGIDSRGASGTPGSVDDHPWQVAKGLGLLAAVTLLSAEVRFQAANLNSPALIDITKNTGEEAQNIGQKYVDRALDIQPTIHVKAGKKIYVFINTDLALPQYYQKY